MKRAILVTLAVLALALPVAQAQDPDLDYWGRTPLPQTGLATYYAVGMMEYVQANRSGRGELPPCPECVGMVALLRAGDIGRKVWLQPPGGEAVGPFLVIDCARRQDAGPLLVRNWVVDVSYEVGQLWGMTRPLDQVTVLEDPADVAGEPAARSWGIPTPFRVAPDEVSISRPTPTPLASPGVPTPWPTRWPVALAGAAQPAAAGPTVVIPPTRTPGPPPLTPIITTPTPAVTQAPTLAGATALPPTAEPTPEPEVALGRPGAGLLGDGPEMVPTPLPAPSSVVRATPTSTRTPRPNLTPILSGATPTPAPATPEPPFQRLWRRFLGLILG